ncbi:unnamed protein product [Lactuca saligna]|uniref:Uncharacterized protein n=1 Tax=Lactuca saligna TaxID=75948 RepID=A0AA36EPK4_LACSI|nr:unnamed protein product [Lactuca saligna]
MMGTQKSNFVENKNRTESPVLPVAVPISFCRVFNVGTNLSSRNSNIWFRFIGSYRLLVPKIHKNIVTIPVLSVLSGSGSETNFDRPKPTPADNEYLSIRSPSSHRHRCTITTPSSRSLPPSSSSSPLHNHTTAQSHSRTPHCHLLTPSSVLYFFNNIVISLVQLLYRWVGIRGYASPQLIYVLIMRLMIKVLSFLQLKEINQVIHKLLKEASLLLKNTTLLKEINQVNQNLSLISDQIGAGSWNHQEYTRSLPYGF